MMTPVPFREAILIWWRIGLLMHGVKGGVVAGVLFILPGAFAIMALSWCYVLLGNLELVEGLFFGLKAAVLVIVFQSLLKIAGRTLQGRLKPALAAVAFISLFVFNLPFPLVIIAAGITGYLSAVGNDHINIGSGHGRKNTVSPGTSLAALLCLLLWGITAGFLYALFGADNVFTQLGIFFSKMAIVTFGGAYAVLSYVAQQGVEHYQWLQPGEMLDGLGLAETTPGPLILVTQFVGFLAAFRGAGTESALLAATFGAGLTTWVTFLPCFLWIFAGAPYVESLRSHPSLSAALATITAAVVGVIANLALWFAINVLFRQHFRLQSFGLDVLIPEISSLDLPMLILVIIAFISVFVLRLGVLPVIGLCAVLGVVWKLIA